MILTEIFNVMSCKSCKFLNEETKYHKGENGTLEKSTSYICTKLKLNQGTQHISDNDLVNHELKLKAYKSAGIIKRISNNVQKPVDPFNKFKQENCPL